MGLAVVFFVIHSCVESLMVCLHREQAKTQYLKTPPRPLSICRQTEYEYKVTWTHPTRRYHDQKVAIWSFHNLKTFIYFSSGKLVCLLTAGHGQFIGKSPVTVGWEIP